MASYLKKTVSLIFVVSDGRSSNLARHLSSKEIETTEREGGILERVVHKIPAVASKGVTSPVANVGSINLRVFRSLKKKLATGPNGKNSLRRPKLPRSCSALRRRRTSWLASDLQQTTTWSKSSPSGNRHLTRFLLHHNISLGPTVE